MARFGNGFTGRHVPTLGELRFSSMRREVYVQNEDGTRSDVVQERTYDLKSKTQGRMIQVSIPASVPVRDYPYNAVVDLVGAKFGAVAHATFGDNADVDWYIKAEDIVLVKQEPASVPKMCIRDRSYSGMWKDGTSGWWSASDCGIPRRRR